MKIAYIENCYICPYCVYDDGFDKHLCMIKFNDMELSTDESIITEEMLIAKDAPDDCPLEDAQHDNSC